MTLISICSAIQQIEEFSEDGLGLYGKLRPECLVSSCTTMSRLDLTWFTIKDLLNLSSNQWIELLHRDFVKTRLHFYGRILKKYIFHFFSSLQGSYWHCFPSTCCKYCTPKMKQTKATNPKNPAFLCTRKQKSSVIQKKKKSSPRRSFSKTSSFSDKTKQNKKQKNDEPNPQRISCVHL